MVQNDRSAHSVPAYESSYLETVLRLQDGDTETLLDERLLSEAKELGVDVCIQAAPKSHAIGTFSPEQARRCSMASSVSQSTDAMSSISELSMRQSRASFTFRDYDNFVARGKPSVRNSMSFSPSVTPSHSAVSLPLSSPTASPKRSSRAMRGLSMLRLRRSDSSSSSTESCPHCPPVTSQRELVHKLPCGHKLCTQALRNTIRAATESQTGAIPSCCGTPIPGRLLESIMTHEEQIILLDRLELWDDTASRAGSSMSEVKDVQALQRPNLSSRRASDESKVDSVAPRVPSYVDKVQNRPEFKELQTAYAEEHDRFIAWIDTKRAELVASHERLRTEMRSRHESAIDNLHDHHADTMAEAEDKQVQAEADMREAHCQEKRDNATALKHMEAYCAGTYSTGEAHNRTITDQDRAELDKTRRIRETMDGKHARAINVLRGEQGRRMKLRAQRLDKEVQELQRAHRKDELELERACTAELHTFDEFLPEKKSRTQARRDLQTAILAKQAEKDVGYDIDVERAQ